MVGRAISHYEIIDRLGAGGMGEVFRAHDKRLSRDVAIKVLPEEVSDNPERLARFDREARTLAALCHPNILAIYDVGTEKGVAYLVTELLEGETLRQRLNRERLPWRQALEIAASIADGLAAAHGKGITHRDIKPENVFLTADGRVKVLDFGLARMAASSTATETTVTLSDQITAAGMVLGTAGYMAPEQVRGQVVDHRADLFALGAILYEMLAGQRAFHGGSAIETMNAILKDEPPDLHAPPGLDRVVRRCLEKTPARRFHSAADLAFALETLSGSTAAAPSQPAAAPSAKRRWPAAVAAIMVAAGFLAAFLVGRRTAEVPVPDYHPLTFQRGTMRFARFGPDGQTVVYSAAWNGEPSEIFSTRADSFESRPLGLKNAVVLSVSSGGELAILTGLHTVAPFIGVGTLARVPLAGGTPREVLEDVEDADWTPDGKALVIVHRVNGMNRLESPIGHTVYETANVIDYLRLSPDGRRIAFNERHTQGDPVGVCVFESGKRRVLAPLPRRTFWGLAWSASGDEVWFSAAETSLHAFLTAVTLSGRQRVVARIPDTLMISDVARDGRVLLMRQDYRVFVGATLPGDNRERDLSWLETSFLVDASAEGKTILLAAAGGLGTFDLYLRNASAASAIHLGSTLWLFGAALSPDQKQVLAVSAERPDQLTILPTGPGASRNILVDNIASYIALGWFPTGDRVAFVGSEPGQGPRLFVVSLAGGKATPVSPQGDAANGVFAIAPDGRSIAALSATGTLCLYPVDGGPPRQAQGAAPGDRPLRWSEDGQALYVAQMREQGATIEKLDLRTGRKQPWKVIAIPDPAGVVDSMTGEPLGRGGFSRIFLTSDAKGFVYSYTRMFSQLYLGDGLR